ncbi:CoA transferase [Pseudomonas fluorescens]|uniref:CoA transferase n=1 Tax=Pseudomonas fluorescens TaxID=294 RepID=UPI000A71D6C8|nr:CoA transferase [Pseudomonas fluorescens]
MVAAYNGNRWATLCKVLGHEEGIADPRFVSSAQRVIHRAELCAALTDVFISKPTAHWLHVLHEADALCSKVADYSDLMKHSQIASNGMLVEHKHPVQGVVRVPGVPIKSVQAAQTPYTPAPKKR